MGKLSKGKIRCPGNDSSCRLEVCVFEKPAVEHTAEKGLDFMALYTTATGFGGLIDFAADSNFAFNGNHYFTLICFVASEIS